MRDCDRCHQKKARKKQQQQQQNNQRCGQFSPDLKKKKLQKYCFRNENMTTTFPAEEAVLLGPTLSTIF